MVSLTKKKKIYKYIDKRNAIHNPEGTPRIDKRSAKNNVKVHINSTVNSGVYC